MKNKLRTLWAVLLALVLGFAVQAQQQVNNFRVLTNLYVGNAITGLTLNGYNIDAIATNSAAGKLDTTNGTAVNLTGSLTNVTVDGVPSASLVTGALLPLAGGTNYWALGDSQTYGEYTVSFPWADGSKRLFESLRYPNILATKYGLNLTNRGVSGNRYAYTATATQNGLAQANVIPLNWSGLVTVALGYNDAGSDRYGTPQRTFAMFRSAAGSLIARLHAATWTVGTGLRNDGSTDSSFATTGTVSDGGNAGYAPFPYGNPASDTRKLLSLEPGDTVTFDATNAAVWFQTVSNGGILQLFQGTNYLAAGNGDSDDSATYNLPQVLLANGYSGTFTVTNVSGTNVVLAVGSIAEPDVTRTVILAGPLQLGDYTIRSDGTCALIASAVMAAAQDWASYRVGYADWQERMDTSTMLESSDLSHPNPFGQKAMVAALENAKIPEAIPALGSPAARWTDRGFQVSGAPTSVSQYVQRPGLILAHAASIGYLDSYSAASAAFLPLNIRASATHVSTGPLQVSGAASSVSLYATNASVVISETGGVGNIGSLYTDGTNATYTPLSVDALTTHVRTGPFQVSGAASSLSQYATNASVVISEVGGIGYINALYTDGTNATYIPLTVDAETTHVRTGPFQVSGTASGISSYATNASVVISESGGIGYINSFYTDGANVTYIPLSLDAQATHVRTGPLQVSGAASGVSAYVTNASVVISEASGTGNIGALYTDGTTATYIPLAVDALTTHVRTGPFQVSGSASGVSSYATNASVVIAESGGTGYIDASYTDGTNATYLPLQLRATTVTVPNSGGFAVGTGAGNRGMSINSGSGSISFIDFQSASAINWRVEKGSASSGFNIVRYSGGSPVDTPLSISLTTGRVTMPAAPVFGNTTTALTYSGTNVTFAPVSTISRATLTLTNDCLLTITASDGYSGGITIAPNASTSYTVYLDSGIKFLGGGSSFVVTNSATETVNLEWQQTLRGASALILANKAVYP